MQLLGILVWWLLITVIGLAAAPLALKTFPSLPDRGYAFSKPLGLLLVGLAAWLIGFIHFSLGSILFCLLLLAGLSWWLWQRHRDEWLPFVRANLRHFLIVELFFLALFLLFLVFRM